MAKLVLKPELSPKHYKALLDAAYEAEGCMQPTAGKLLVLISLPLLVVWWVEDFGAHAGAGAGRAALGAAAKLVAPNIFLSSPDEREREVPL